MFPQTNIFLTFHNNPLSYITSINYNSIITNYTTFNYISIITNYTLSLITNAFIPCFVNYYINDPETVLLIDAWESQEAIDAHHASPMMQTISKLREKYDLHMKVERYVSDDMPKSDEGFIRT